MSHYQEVQKLLSGDQPDELGYDCSNPNCYGCFCPRCTAKMSADQLKELEDNYCPFCGTELIEHGKAGNCL